MIIDICITRTVFLSLKRYGMERLARWTWSIARRRLRLVRSGRVLHV